MIERAAELHEIFKGIDANKQKIVSPLIDEAVYLEKQLQELKQYKHIKVHPENPNLQKVTAAGKMYRELLQTYVNCMDKLMKYYTSEKEGEESPVEAYFRRKLNGEV